MTYVLKLSKHTTIIISITVKVCDRFEQKQAYGWVKSPAEVCLHASIDAAHFRCNINPPICLLLLEAVTFMISDTCKFHISTSFSLPTGRPDSLPSGLPTATTEEGTHHPAGTPVHHPALVHPAGTAAGTRRVVTAAVKAI